MFHVSILYEYNLKFCNVFNNKNIILVYFCDLSQRQFDNFFIKDKLKLMDSIDCMEAKYKFVGVRKHFFKDVTYYITVYDDMVTMGIV